MTRKNVVRVVMLLTVMLGASACSAEKIELQKSPCASLDGGPCGPKRQLNGNLPHQQPDHA